MTVKRVAFLSDVHGNSPALQAVLQNIASFEVEELISLGDIINGMDPQGCVQLLRDWSVKQNIKLTCIMGNAEAYLVTPNRHELCNYGEEWWPSLVTLIDWYQERLSEENLAWIRTWPMTMRWRDATLLHDSPIDRIIVETKSKAIIKPEHREWFFHGRGISTNFSEKEWGELDAFLKQQMYQRVFCGHTHEAFIREKEGKIICNVGSAGAPLDGDWHPAWVLLEIDEAGNEHLRIQRVEYDLSRIYQLIDATPTYPDFQKRPGMMDAFKTWYATGIHWRVHVPNMLPPREPRIADFSQARMDMVERDIFRRGVIDEAVLDAMRNVPREWFVDPQDKDLAYIDGPLGIDCGQTISQPYIVALMAELLELTPEKTVMEIGTGSGYAAAILGQIAHQVFTVERHGALATRAIERFLTNGYDNVCVRVGDGTQGWEAFAPYDAILVSAGAPHIPDALKAQLKVGGILVIPLGKTHFSQWLVQVKKVGENDFEEKRICPVRFVPLVGQDGWKN